jgi:two-component system, cell cycle sensor histidine kinase and response regulator CckA
VASVLVVDDNTEVLDVVCAVLTSAGHAVERADGGLSALDILDQGKPLDLLLTDVVMPGLHGFNLARMAVLRRQDLRVLYFTGNADMEVVKHDSGPKYGKMLHKPLHPDDLKREVDEALASSPRALSEGWKP